jgi:hypothetical protein
MNDTGYKLYNRFIDWSQTATKEESSLAGKVIEFEDDYFNDMLFTPDSITGDFFAVEIQDDSGKTLKVYEDTPFDTSLQGKYIFKISKMKSAVGRCNPKKLIIYIHPKYQSDKNIILHEMIHAYEGILLGNPLGRILRDILFVSLYNSLKPRIENLDDLIKTHGHIYEQEDIATKGGIHGILFYLKSLDLDLRLNLKLGTVCGYGRDMYNTGEEM